MIALTEGMASVDDDSATIMTPEEEEVWLGKYFSGKGSTGVVEEEAKKSGSMDPTTIDEQMENLEREFEESMRVAAACGSAEKQKQLLLADAAAAKTTSNAALVVGEEEQQRTDATTTSKAAVAEEKQLRTDATTTSNAAVAGEEQLSVANVEEGRMMQTREECLVRKVYSELHMQADPEIVAKLRLAMEGIPEGTKGLEDCRTYFASKQHYTLQDVLVGQYVLNDGLLMRQGHSTEDEYHVDITEPLM